MDDRSGWSQAQRKALEVLQQDRLIRPADTGTWYSERDGIAGGRFYSKTVIGLIARGLVRVRLEDGDRFEVAELIDRSTP